MMSKEREWLLREKYNGIESPEFFADLARIESGEPVDYVIGFSKFLGARIDLSYRPLIPRTETEYWTEKAIAELDLEKNIQILDIFSGSGCIGIAALLRLPNAQADFADIDPQFMQQIKKNCEHNQLDAKRYSVFQSDVFAGVPQKKYDVIFANPPYIGKEKGITDESVIAHEPHRALFADDNGLALIDAFLSQAQSYLNSGGKIYLEHDHDQAEDVAQLLKKYGYADFELHKDQFGNFRWVSAAA